MGAPITPTTSKPTPPGTRSRANSGTKRQHELMQVNPSTGLTPILGGLAMTTSEAPRKTPKHTAASTPSTGQLPEALELPTKQTESDDSDDDGMSAMIAFHQKKNGRTAVDESTILGGLPLLDADQPVEEADDGWATVKKAPRRKKSQDQEYEVPEDAYVDPEWSEDDGCDYDTYSDAKRGGNHKGKHCNTFNAARSRNMQIAKRDAQRGYSK